MEIPAGTVLLGKYRVDAVLGTGGMGQVVQASHLYLQQQVAIKILLPQMAESASTVTRFLREAQSTVKLKSEHIAKVYDVGTMPNPTGHPTPFIVMEYLDGNDLNQILRHHGPQQSAIVCDLMLQACEGLAEAHAMGIVHRDIKPSNFFITRRNDGSMLLKILDFGISKTAINITELTGTQTILGTPQYMSPEQMKSGKETEPRSDLWSLGVVMYQLLTGRPPFNGETYAELVLKVNGDPPAPIMVPLPPGLGEVVLKCLEKDPKNRFQNVGDLARSLAPYATDPISAAQSAARATRILTARSTLQGIRESLPHEAGGGLTTPIPISPAQLTPRSWPPTGSSVSGGAGQVTYKTRSGRGWIIAGIAVLVGVAGAGGFVANEMMKEGDSRRAEPHVTAPPSKDDTAAAKQPAETATTPPPVEVKTETKTDTRVPATTLPDPKADPKTDTKTDVANTDPKADTKKVDIKKVDTKKVDTKKIADGKKTDGKKTDGKKTDGKKTDKKTDDLFGTRK